MSAPHLYITSLLSIFDSFLATKRVATDDIRDAQLLFLDFVHQKDQFERWSIAELELFLAPQSSRTSLIGVFTGLFSRRQSDTPEHKTNKVAHSLLRQFVREYTPHQANVYLHEYLLALKAENCSETTIKNYRSDINQFLSFFPPQSLKQLLSRPKLTIFLKSEMDKGLKISSIKRKLSSISQFALWTVRQGLLANVQQDLDWLREQVLQLEVQGLPHSSDMEHSQQQNSVQNTNYSRNVTKTWSLPLGDEPHSAIVTQASGSGGLKSADQLKQATAQSKQDYRARLKAHLAQVTQSMSQAVSARTPSYVLPYVNLGITLLFMFGLSLFGYQQFIKQVDAPLAFPTTPTRPNRELSFQGRLTDSAQNPITTSTDMRFRLYDSGPSTSGGTLLWDSGTCSVTPDQDGIFATGLGDDCGSEITSDVFSENANVWLQVDIEAETLSPRQSIKTVAYALNSETLQGYPIDASGAATVSTVVTMNDGGQIVLGEVSPRIRSVSGTFALEGQALTLQTSSGSNGNITIDPDGTGIVNILSSLTSFEGYIRAPGATLSATYAGGTALVARGGPSGTANIQEWQNSAGTARSVVDENGNLGIGTSNPLVQLQVTNNSSPSIRIAQGSTVDPYLQLTYNTSNDLANIYAVNEATTNKNLELGGENLLFATSISGNVQDGSSNIRMYISSGGNIGIGTTNPSSFLLQTAGSIGPNTDSTYDLGSASLAWANIYGDSIFQSGNQVCDSSGTGCPAAAATYWDQQNGSLYPLNSTVDLLIGGQATTSAKFAFLNVNGGTPTASISANSGNNATTLTGTGILGTTNRQTLSLGSSTTGNLSFAPGGSVAGTWLTNGNLGIGTTAPVDGLTIGQDKGLSLSDSDVAHSFTTLFNTNVYGNFDYISSSRGGLQITGINDGGSTGSVKLVGLLDDGGNASPQLIFTAGIPDGANGVQNLGDTRALAQFQKYDGTALITIRGNGNLGIGTSSPSQALEAVGAIRSTLEGSAGSPNFLTNDSNSGLYGGAGGGVGLSSNGSQRLLISGTEFSIKSSAGTADDSALVLEKDGNWVDGEYLALGWWASGGSADLARIAVEQVASGDYRMDFYTTTSGTGGVTTRMSIDHTGNVGIGTTDPFSFILQTAGDIGPNADSTYDLGSASLAWAEIYGDTIYQGGNQVCDSSGAGCPAGSSAYWDQANGTLYPYNSTVDLLIGGQSTASAKFAFLNANGGTPVASISANSGNIATYLTGDGTLSTTNRQTLSIGGTPTGNLSFAPGGTVAGTWLTNGNLGIGTTAPVANLEVSASAGSNSIIYISDDDVTHGVTTVAPTNTYGRLGPNSSTLGGLQITGLDDGSGGANGALQLRGIHNDGSSSWPAVVIRGGLASGTGTTNLGTTRSLFRIVNDDLTTTFMDLDGGGKVAFNQNASTISAGSPASFNFSASGSNISVPALRISHTSSAYSNSIISLESARTESSSYNFIQTIADNDGTPSYPFVVKGNGNVGIGTTTPSQKIDVIGGVKLGAGASANSVLNTAAGSATTEDLYWGDDLLCDASETTCGWLTSASLAWTYSAPYLYPNNATDFVGIGTTTTSEMHGLFTVSGARTGKALAVFNETGDQDILTASASGVTRMRLASDGALHAGRFSDISNSSYFLDPANGGTALAIDGSAGIGTASPVGKLHVTGAITGKALTILNETGDQNIFTASASGTTRFVIQNDGNVGIGTTAPVRQLHIHGAPAIAFTNATTGSTSGDGAFLATSGGLDFIISQQESSGNLRFLTGGSTRLTIDTSANGGWIGIGNSVTSPTARLDVRNSSTEDILNLYDSSTEVLTVLDGGNVGIGDASPSQLFTVGNGDLFQVDSSGDLVKINNVAYTWPDSQGSADTALINDGSGNLSWTAISGLGTNYWGQQNGSLYPFNSTVDLLIGGQSTASAKFAFINVNSGIPTATISANSGNIATYLTGDGTLSTTNRQTLTLGGTSTGNLSFAPGGTVRGTWLTNGNLGIGTTAPLALLNPLSTTEQLRLSYDASNYASFTTDSSGNLGIDATGTGVDFADHLAIGTDATLLSNRIINVDEDLNADADLYGMRLAPTFDMTPTTARNVYGLNIYARPDDLNQGAQSVSAYGIWSEVDSVTSTLQSIQAGRFEANIISGASVDNINGVIAQAYNSGSSTSVTTITGISSMARNNESTAVGTLRSGIFTVNQNSVGGQVDTGYGLYLDLINNGEITTHYGLYINDIIEGTQTNAYGIWANEGDWVLDDDGDGIAGGTGGGDIFLGEGQDAAIWYDGTDLAINPQVVGSGNLSLEAGNFLPGTDSSQDIGSLSLAWANIYGDTIYQSGNQVCDSSGTGCPAAAATYWGQANGTLYPYNSTVDLLVGGQSTASAKFKVLNINSGTPVASISANSGNIATYLTGDGTLSTTNRQTLTLGGTPTGNLSFAPGGSVAGTWLTNGNLGIGTTVPVDGLTVSEDKGLSLTDSDVAHSFTSIANTNVYGQFGYISNARGGLQITGINDGGSTGSVKIVGLLDDGGNASPQLIFTAGIPNAGSAQNLGDTRVLAQFQKYDGTALISVMGSGNLGVGTNNAVTKLNVLATTEQLRLAYDASNYSSFTIGSTGALTLAQTGTGGAINLTSSLASGGTTTAALNFKTSIDLGAADEVFQVGDSAADFLTILGNGNVGIGDSSPSQLFTVGSGDLFQVDSSGDLVKINNVTYAWPSSQAAGSGYVLTNDGAGTLTWNDTSAFGVNYWRLANGALSPVNDTLDLLIGSNATASAKFAFVNVNSGTPTATISANSGNNATSLTGTGVLGTTNRQTLTLGSSSTGNLTFAPGGSVAGTWLTNGNLGIGTTAPSSLFELRGPSSQHAQLRFSDPDITAHTVTDVLPSNTWGELGIYDANNGGISLTGVNRQVANAAPSVLLYGIREGGNGNAVVTVRGASDDGGTGIQQFPANANSMFNIQSYISSAWTDVFRVGSTGRTWLGGEGYGNEEIFEVEYTSTGDPKVARIYNSNDGTGFDGVTLSLESAQAPNSGFDFLQLISDYNGTPTTEFIIQGDGNVGIGSDAPSQALDVIGGVKLGAGASANSVLNTAAGSATTEDLYWGDDLVCDASATDCGWLTSASLPWTYSAPYLYPTNATDFVGIGTTTTSEMHGLFTVSGARTGKALAIFNETGDQDILTASASGVTRLRLATDGSLHAGRFSDISNSSYFLDPANGGTALAIDGSAGIGTASPVGKLHVTGAITGKALTILNATGDQNIFTASASGTTRFVIQNDGNVGIGTSSPNSMLQVGLAGSGNLSVPGAGSSSEAFGAGAIAGGNFGVALGYGADAGASGEIHNIAIGYLANAGSGGSDSGIAIGSNSVSSAGSAIALGNSASSGGSNTIAIGAGSTISGSSGISIGQGSTVGGTYTISIGAGNTISAGAGNNYSIVLGSVASATSTNQFVVGSETAPITNMYIGEGVRSATPQDFTLNATGGTGTDIAAGDLYIAGGKATGNAAGGDIFFQTSDAGSSGTTLQSLSTKMTISNSGNVGIGIATPTSFKLQVAGNVGPNADSTYDLGSASLAWANIYGDTIYQGGNQVCDSSGTGCPASATTYWDQVNGTLYPYNSTVDLLIGGQSTASAKFKVLNINSGTPVASISANSGNIASYLTGDGTLSTTNRQTLSIGGTPTGNISFAPGGTVRGTWLTNGNLGIGTTTAPFLLTTAGDIGPSANDTYNLGSTSGRWQDIYLGPGSIHIGNAITDEATISYNAAGNILNFNTDSTSNGDIAFFEDDLYLDKSSSNVGIGTTSPGSLLDVNGSASIRGALLTVGTNDTQLGTLNLYGHATGQTEGGEINLYLSADHDTTFENFAIDTLNDDLRIHNNGTVRFLIEDTTSVQARLVNNVGNQAMCYNGADISADALRQLGDCDSAVNADYMEMYSVENGIGIADIVVAGPTYITTDHGERVAKLTKSTKAYQNGVIGIISDKSKAGDFNSIGYNIKASDNPQPVALAGRVPVKVTSANGAIAIGDPITSSAIAGVGMKATRAGQIVGRALESYVGQPGEIGTVMVYVTNSWYDPAMQFDTAGQLVITGQNQEYVATPVGSNKPLVQLAAYAQVVTAKLTAGVVKTQELVVERSAQIASAQVGDLVVTNLTVGGQTIRDYILNIVQESQNSTQLAQNNQDSATTGQLISPIVDSDTINTQQLNSDLIAGSTATISGRTQLGNLLVDDSATIAGTLEADTIRTNTVETDTLIAQGFTTDTLTANSARMEKLEAKLAELEAIKAQTAELVNATVSGTLYANDIYNFEEKIAQSFQKPSLLSVLMNQLNPSQTATSSGEDPANIDTVYETIASTGFSASDSANLNLTLADLELGVDDIALEPTAVFIDQYLKVNGVAYVADTLGIGNQIKLDGGLEIGSDYIAYNPAPSESELSPVFSIQPSGQGTLSLLAGLMTLSENGQVVVNGDFYVAGDLEVEGTLLGDLIQPREFGNPLQVQVAGVATESGKVKESRFEIINEIGTPVATFSAQGRAEFAGGVAVGTQDLSLDNATEPEAQKTSGRASIAAGNTSISIKSKLLTEKSLVYITPANSTGNQVLYVKSQIPADKSQVDPTLSYTEQLEQTQPGSFSVGFDQPLSNDVVFNWWIVN